ncbi:hypothetical protein [Curtobacterium sp. ZW137]|uniref:hypothetical protein n=1 Tax=Curtobacterium sp. ZW137 TaxID=2485104 RepID=UPI000F4B2240|nr:hypothetical protein [Curtobacterium sp. ZW137]
MTAPGWRSVRTPLVDLVIPDGWQEVDAHGQVLAVAAPDDGAWTFRPNGVLSVRPSTEPIHVLGARAISEARAHPVWSHVVADPPWFREGGEGRVVESLYETDGMCVSVTRYVIATGRHAIDLTMSASIRDRFLVEDQFDIIAGGMEVKDAA